MATCREGGGGRESLRRGYLFELFGCETSRVDAHRQYLADVLPSFEYQLMHQCTFCFNVMRNIHSFCIFFLFAFTFKQRNFKQRDFKQRNFKQRNFKQRNFKQRNFKQRNFKQRNFKQRNFKQRNLKQGSFKQRNLKQRNIKK